MKRLRYYTESLPSHKDGGHHPSQVSAMSVHSRRYHWVRLDDQMIMGYAELAQDSFSRLIAGHDTLALHPSLHDKKSVKHHLETHYQGKHANHFARLATVLGADSNDTTADLVGRLVEAGHTAMAPDI